MGTIALKHAGMPLKHRVFRVELAHTRTALYVARRFIPLLPVQINSFAVGSVRVLVRGWR